MKMFFDESGNDGISRAFLLGGFGVSNQALGPFDEEWRNTLAMPPAIQYFKHSEAQGRSGQFEAWMPEAIEQKVFSLADVIAKHAQFGIVSIFPHALYQYVTSESIVPERTIQRVMNGFDPYSLCAHDAMSSTIQMAIVDAKTGPIDFTFDAGQTSFEDCKRIYETLKPMIEAAGKSVKTYHYSAFDGTVDLRTRYGADSQEQRKGQFSGVYEDDCRKSAERGRDCWQ